MRERLEWLGRERALTYKTLVLTGLRKGELASLTVAHLHLDDAVPLASPSTPPTKRTVKGTTLPYGMTSPRTCGMARRQAAQAASGSPGNRRTDTGQAAGRHPLFNVPANS